jgi:hypothetical protein
MKAGGFRVTLLLTALVCAACGGKTFTDAGPAPADASGGRVDAVLGEGGQAAGGSEVGGSGGSTNVAGTTGEAGSPASGGEAGRSETGGQGGNAGTAGERPVLGCDIADECDSRVCLDGVCQEPACDDTVQNSDETDVDCGGPDCPPCPQDAQCCDAPSLMSVS